MEEAIEAEHEVRVIDLFVDSLDIEKMGLEKETKRNIEVICIS